MVVDRIHYGDPPSLILALAKLARCSLMKVRGEIGNLVRRARLLNSLVRSKEPFRMVVVKFFAGAREAAGVSSTEVEAGSVKEALDLVISLYGNELKAIIGISKVWLNGEQANLAAMVSDGDEIAILPPVSGGV